MSEWDRKKRESISFKNGINDNKLTIEAYEDKLYFGIDMIDNRGLVSSITWQEARVLKEWIEKELFVRRL